MDCVVHGLTESRTRLSDFHFHFHPACEDFSLGDAQRAPCSPRSQETIMG